MSHNMSHNMNYNMSYSMDYKELIIEMLERADKRKTRLIYYYVKALL